VDAAGFGQIVSTVNVGVNPTMVSVLQDGSRAYVVNSGNAANGVEGSVSVVNLQSGVVTATIPAVSSATAVANTPTAVFGHPNSISATTGTPTGKVYVTSPDSEYLTVIYTDTDSVSTHIPLQGMGLRVLVSAQ
jgi:YVTN family beta-propeller protein